MAQSSFNATASTSTASAPPGSDSSELVATVRPRGRWLLLTFRKRSNDTTHPAPYFNYRFMGKSCIKIGRQAPTAEDLDVSLSCISISDVHLIIECKGDDYFLECPGEKGVFIDDRLFEKNSPAYKLRPCGVLKFVGSPYFIDYSIVIEQPISPVAETDPDPCSPPPVLANPQDFSWDLPNEEQEQQYVVPKGVTIRWIIEHPPMKKGQNTDQPAQDEPQAGPSHQQQNIGQPAEPAKSSRHRRNPRVQRQQSPSASPSPIHSKVAKSNDGQRK